MRLSVAAASFASTELYGAFEALRVAFETNANRWNSWPFHHEAVSQRNRGTDGCDLRVSANHRDQVGLCLSWLVWQKFTDEAVQPQFHIGRGLSVIFT